MIIVRIGYNTFAVQNYNAEIVTRILTELIPVKQEDKGEWHEREEKETSYSDYNISCQKISDRKFISLADQKEEASSPQSESQVEPEVF